MSDDLEYRIGKLRLEPGDVLVVKVNERLTHEAAYRVRRQMETFVVGSNKILVIDPSCDLSVLTAAEIASRT